MDPIYLDYAANYPVSQEALDALCLTEKEIRGNMNSVHVMGKMAAERFEKLNASVLSLLGLSPDAYDVIYTSSATESNNLAIKGYYESHSGYGSRLICSEFEHSSVNATMAYLKDKGADIVMAGTDDKGRMDLADLQAKLNDRTLLVSCPLIESEVGTIQDYEAIQRTVNGSKAVFLLDATQAVGKYPLHLDGIDMVSFTPHKFGGLIGTGVLIKKKSIVITPLIHGGKSATIYRAGSVPVGLIASIEASLKSVIARMDESFRKVTALDTMLRNGLEALGFVRINSFEGNPYILNFSVNNVMANRTVAYLSSKGICVSQKSACSVPNTPSKVINAIYHDKKRAMSSLRVSISALTSEADIQALLDALKEMPH